jgi:S-disulfanyl-L-cysteine oxidoreductase SoxD
MSSLLKASALILAASLYAVTGPAPADEAHPPGYYGYGRTPTQTETEGWAIAVRPDGQGLPPGKGSVNEGADMFADQCAACHGTFGEGEGRYPKLSGGSLKGERPEPTVGSYWPYATTLWDYINRAMPFPAPHSLTADQVYAMTAYILNLNNIVPGDFVADRNTLPKVKMPNHDAFIWKDPRPDTASKACMANCFDPSKVRIESTAEGKDLTPRTTGPLDDMQPK